MSDFRPEPKTEPIDWSARLREAERDDEFRAEEPYDLSDLRGYEPVHPESPLRSFLRKLWVPIAFVGALFWKFKAVAVAIFKFKFLATALSGFVSVAAYALLWGWWFAVGLVVLLFIHEMGHVLEARRQGLPASAPMFIPFLGALIALKQLPDDAWREARRHTLTRRGGHGAVREFAEQLLRARGQWNEVVERYVASRCADEEPEGVVP